MINKEDLIDLSSHFPDNVKLVATKDSSYVKFEITDNAEKIKDCFRRMFVKLCEDQDNANITVVFEMTVNKEGVE